MPKERVPVSVTHGSTQHYYSTLTIKPGKSPKLSPSIPHRYEDVTFAVSANNGLFGPERFTLVRETSISGTEDVEYDYAVIGAHLDTQAEDIALVQFVIPYNIIRDAKKDVSLEGIDVLGRGFLSLKTHTSEAKIESANFVVITFEAHGRVSLNWMIKHLLDPIKHLFALAMWLPAQIADVGISLDGRRLLPIVSKNFVLHKSYSHNYSNLFDVNQLTVSDIELWLLKYEQYAVYVKNLVQSFTSTDVITTHHLVDTIEGLHKMRYPKGKQYGAGRIAHLMTDEQDFFRTILDSTLRVPSLNKHVDLKAISERMNLAQNFYTHYIHDDSRLDRMQEYYAHHNIAQLVYASYIVRSLLNKDPDTLLKASFPGVLSNMLPMSISNRIGGGYGKWKSLHSDASSSSTEQLEKKFKRMVNARIESSKLGLDITDDQMLAILGFKEAEAKAWFVYKAKNGL